MPPKTDPLAAHLDAIVDAHHHGVDDADTNLLAEIGEDFAAFAEQLAAKLNRLSDGRIVTTWVGSGERRQMATVNAADLCIGMIEGAVDLLDAVPVIKTAARLRLEPAATRKAA